MKGLNFFGRKVFIKAAGVRWYVGDTFSVPTVYKGTLKVVAIYKGRYPYISCVSLDDIGPVHKDAITSYTISAVNLDFYHGRDMLYSNKIEESEGW